MNFLNRILNPRIVLKKKKVGLFLFIQSELDGKGRFQIKDKNTIRYIIGAIEGIFSFIDIVHSKLRRAAAYITINHLIKFMNNKYKSTLVSKGLKEIPFSLLNNSDLGENSWLTGFTESDGHFVKKIVEAKQINKRLEFKIVNTVVPLTRGKIEAPHLLALGVWEASGKKLQSSGLFIFLLNYLNLNIDESNQPMVIFLSNIAILSLLGLFCVGNIILFLYFRYLIRESNIEIRFKNYP